MMYCSYCGKECAADANFCPACGKASRNATNGPRPATIVRPRAPRVIAGVCSGFAVHFGWDLMWTRILFTVFTFFTSGVGVILYLIAWVILPDGLYALPPQGLRN